MHLLSDTDGSGSISIWPRGRPVAADEWMGGGAVRYYHRKHLSVSLSEQTKLHPHVRRTRWNHGIISKSAHDPVVGCWMASRWHAANNNNNLSVDGAIERPEIEKTETKPLTHRLMGNLGESSFLLFSPHVKHDAG